MAYEFAVIRTKSTKKNAFFVDSLFNVWTAGLVLVYSRVVGIENVLECVEEHEEII